MSEAFRFLTTPDGVTYLRCEGLDAPHGFSTRLGGESTGPFESLNLGVSAGDDEPTVRRNRARWAAALDFEPPIVALWQIHGDVVHAVDARPTDTLHGDAVVSAAPGLPISVFTADCTPVLLHDPRTGAVGAVHAGWRGTVAHVAVRAVEQMVARFGADPADIVAAIGPAIGPCCFEVGPEVVEAARSAPWPGWDDAVVERSPRDHFDLFAANEGQLLAAGLAPAHVFNSRLCTSCRADMFYSYRRDAGRTGRLQAAIASPGARA
jgi:YfiH family protein